MSGYSIPKFDIEIHFTHNVLESLTLSNNRIEIIGSKIFRNFSLLRTVDLSNNMLGGSNSSSDVLSVLFLENSLLKEIYIANNKLMVLPSETFISNKLLETIDLSGNKLNQITFEISHLKHLTFLNMRDNSIDSLDIESRNKLDKLYKNQRSQQFSSRNNVSFLVDLRGNGFVCDCQSLDFLRWFVESPIFSSTKHSYHCVADGLPVPMTVAAVEAAENDTEKPRRRIRNIVLASVLPTVGVIASFITIAWIRNKWYEWLRHKRVKDYTKLVQNDDLPTKFLAFLSFSSEDERFVAANVLQPFKENLEAITDTDRDLICVGDRYFRLGRTIYSKMNRCLGECAVFIAVMSRNFCGSEYCRLEIEEARVKRMPIILIFIEKVEEEYMNRVTREVFKNYTRAKSVIKEGAYKLNVDWRDVCESIIELVKCTT